ncbi:MAG TPA: hypothetical protein PK954_23785, partial [Anaerolineales bacterium]|nr:hypothetical protein [Anaerolineales bacterium]
MSILWILWWGVVATLAVLSLIVLANLIAYPRLRPASDQPASVSVLIPARNEARVIGDTVARLLASSRAIREELVL